MFESLNKNYQFISKLHKFTIAKSAKCVALSIYNWLMANPFIREFGAPALCFIADTIKRYFKLTKCSISGVKFLRNTKTVFYVYKKSIALDIYNLGQETLKLLMARRAHYTLSGS